MRPIRAIGIRKLLGQKGIRNMQVAFRGDSHGREEDGAFAGGVRREEIRYFIIVKGEAGGSEAVGVRSQIDFPSQDAKPFAIKLTPTVVSAEDLSTPAKKVASVGTEPGLVTVEALDAVYDRLAPQVACFFFSH